MASARNRAASKVRRLRRWYHKRVLHHVVVGSVMRDWQMQDKTIHFYWRRSWYCVNCQLKWPK